MSVLSWGANPHAILSFNASFQNQPTSPSIYLLLLLDINVFLLYILIKSYLFTFRFWEIPFPAPQLCEFCWSVQRNLLPLYLIRIGSISCSRILVCKEYKRGKQHYTWTQVWRQASPCGVFKSVATRELPRRSLILVLLLSKHTQNSDRIPYINVGMIAFVCKNFHIFPHYLSWILIN